MVHCGALAQFSGHSPEGVSRIHQDAARVNGEMAWHLRAALTALTIAAVSATPSAVASSRVTTPNLKAKLYVSAVVALTREHLCVNVKLLATANPASLTLIRRTARHPGEGVRVIRQRPTPGTEVRQWSYVTITVPLANLPYFVAHKGVYNPCHPITPQVVTS
jgi:hypothetical protein